MSGQGNILEFLDFQTGLVEGDEDVTPESNSGRLGGPGGIRPNGTGDGNDVPNLRNTNENPN